VDNDDNADNNDGSADSGEDEADDDNDKPELHTRTSKMETMNSLLRSGTRLRRMIRLNREWNEDGSIDEENVDEINDGEPADETGPVEAGSSSGSGSKDGVAGTEDDK
jgi:hypothetical protein